MPILHAIRRLTRQLLMLWLLTLPSGVAAQNAEQSVADVLDAYHAAASRADEVTYLGLMTADGVFLGTDGTERWQGEQWRAFVHENFSRGRGWTYVPTARRIDVGPDGRLAWFDELLEHDRLGQCRSSGVLLKTTDGWKIAQYNLSVPIPNEIVERVAGEISALRHDADTPTAP